MRRSRQGRIFSVLLLLVNAKLGITLMRYTTAPNKSKSVYYKEHGQHHFLHTRFASTYKSEAELAADPTYQGKHWLLTINGAKERAISIGYKDDAAVRRLVKKHVPGVSDMVFLRECKPLSLKEAYDAAMNAIFRWPPGPRNNVPPFP